MVKIQNNEVAKVFSNYPEPMQQKILFLRQLILETYIQMDGVNKLEETLKWGEPSYLIKKGSTIRIAWKESKPKQYGIYFHCKTKLVDTFRQLYGDTFKYETNRAIIFNENDEVPIEALKYCILLSLTYHSRKHLPTLGT